MKTIVTGSAGFIGSHLVDSLLSDGHEVIGIDDMSAGDMKNLESSLSNPNFVQVELDICSKEIEDLFEGIDIVFHQAASKKNICLKNPHRDLEVNGGGTLNLLQMAHKYNVKKFVHASTGSVYGEPVVFPQDETHPLNPCSYYGVSKLAGERYVAMYNKVFGLNTTILRYFHVYGLRQNYSQDKGGVIAIFLQNLINGRPIIVNGDGNQERSFTYVGDVVRANKLVAGHKDSVGQVYNVASGIRVTINDLILSLEKIIDCKPMVTYTDNLVGDVFKFQVDNTKLASLGMRFSASLEDNLKTMFETMEVDYVHS